MPESTLDAHELHEVFLGHIGDLATDPSQLDAKPLEVALSPPFPARLRVYLYNLTSPPGGRPHDEHKIQLIAPGQQRDERGDFDFSGGALVLLAGYSADKQVYVLWDANLHRTFSWSANVQVRGDTVEEALSEGLATQSRRLRLVDETETVVVARSESLIDGLLTRIELDSAPPLPDQDAPTMRTGQPMGISYREPPGRDGPSKRRVFEVDPDLFDRATDAHKATQNALRDRVRAAGLDPRSPTPFEPKFDLAWTDGDAAWVAEVKSLTNQNEVRQIRYAIGQVLSYRHFLRWDVLSVVPVIALERPPTDGAWVDLCTAIGIQLVWPDTFDVLFR